MAATNGWGGFKLMDPESGFTGMDISREGSVSGSSYSGMSSFSGGSGSTSTMSTTGTDDQGNEILIALERRSVQPFKTQDEYLYAMKEDLAEWFNALYQVNINVDNFFEEIETGVLLCEHANAVQEVIKNSFLEDNPKSYNPRATPIIMQDYYVTYRKNVKPGTFQSRDNISNFLTWCVRLGIPDNLRFESDDLVLRKHERNVILCLLEVARRGAKYGMLAPTIVQMEEEIDAEIAGKEPPVHVQAPVYEPQLPQVQRKTCDLMSLDEMVRNMVSQCTCPSQFPMVKVSDGKYKIGDSQTLIFVRILRNHVMVRIGGGWDTLEHYLDRHDPCRCHAKGRSHGQRPLRGTSPIQVQMSKRSSTPTSAPHLAGLEIKSTFTSKQVPIAENPNEVGFSSKPQSTKELTKQANTVLRQPKKKSKPSSVESPRQRKKVLRQPKNKPISSPRRTSVATSSPSKSVNRSYSPHSTPRKPKRTLPNVPTEAATAIPSPQRTKLQQSYNNSPTVARPKSALERRHSETNQYKHLWKWGSDEDLTVNNPQAAAQMEVNQQKKHAFDRGRPGTGFSTPNKNTTHDEVLLISRDDTGGHRVGFTQKNNNNEQSLNNSMNGHSNNGLQRTFSANRFQITADKLLPSKPKNFTRTASQSSDQSSSDVFNNSGSDKYRAQYSADSDSYSESSATNGSSYKAGGGGGSSSDNSSTKTGGLNSTHSMTMTWSQGSSQSIDASDFDTKSVGDNGVKGNNSNKNFGSSFSLELLEYPEAPPEDLEMNKQMELLFQEYRKIERATLDNVGHSEEVLERLNSTQPIIDRKNVKYKTQKQDFSQVKSKLKDYLMKSPKKAPGTPRREAQHYSQPHQRRSVTPNPTSSSVHRTPTQPRRNLPRPPSPASIGSNSSSSISSHSAFTPVLNALKPNIKGATASSGTTAWRQVKKTADLNSTSKCDTLPRGRPANNDIGTPRKRPSSARPSTPRATTPIQQRPLLKDVEKVKAKPPTFRPSSAPLNRKLDYPNSSPRKTTANSRRGSREDILDSSNIGGGGGGFVVQSSGAWAMEQDKSKSVPPTPYQTPKKTPQKQNSMGTNSKSLAASLRCKSTTCLASSSTGLMPNEHIIHSKDDLITKEKQSEVDKLIYEQALVNAKERKDDRSGPRTKIPQPLTPRCKSADPYSTQLKRCDSGVDINNMSPTEGSNQGDDDMKIPWVNSEGVALSPQALAQFSPFEDKNEFF